MDRACRCPQSLRRLGVPELISALGERVERPSSVLFAPYLSGERTPHNSARLRGGFAGLGQEADRVSMTQGVLEGVAFAFRDCLDALSSAGTRVERAWAGPAAHVPRHSAADWARQERRVRAVAGMVLGYCCGEIQTVT